MFGVVAAMAVLIFAIYAVNEGNRQPDEFDKVQHQQEQQSNDFMRDLKLSDAHSSPRIIAPRQRQTC